MITLNDWSTYTPQSAVSTTPRTGAWHLLDYEAEGISGAMLSAGELTNPPEVTLPLGVKGWHGIYVGFWNPNLHETRHTVIKLRLTGDGCFRRIWYKAPETTWLTQEIHEVFWQDADLTDRDLVIGKLNHARPTVAHVAYVKLAPLSDEEAEAIQRDRARTDTRKLIALNDGCSFLNREACKTEAELLEQVESYRHSDVGTVFWAVNYGELTNYPSKFGMLAGSGYESFLSRGRQQEIESSRTLIANGIVPFEAVMKRVREMRLEFHTQFRLGILTGGHLRGQHTVGFAAKHPEFRILHRDGTPLPKLSYAFDEVRQLMLSLMAEVGQRDVDGFNLCFIRGPMYVGYEGQAVEDFKRKYDQDPRQIDENDERWQRHKADYVTQFTRDAKKLADEIGAKRGRKLQLSAMIYESEAMNLYHGLDVRTWVQEGLLDFIILGLGKGNDDFVQTIQDANCAVVSDVGARTPENYVRAAQVGQAAGAKGISVWDMNYPQDFPDHWAVLRVLGHDDRVEAFAREMPAHKTIQMKNIGGLDVCHTCNKDAPGGWPPEMTTLITCG